MLGTMLQRRRRLARYKRIRAELERLTDADLADAGLRRYQLSTIARIQAFRNTIH